jgi:Protein of unknown function (DUF2950)
LLQCARTTGRLSKKFWADSGPLLSSGDPVADAQVRQDFIAALAEGDKVVQEGNNRAVPLVGKQEWPFPIPLVRRGKGWYIDTKAGAIEILDRRIGRNELSTIEVCRAYVDAQREYNSKNQEYAQKILSSPGKRGGLYWPAATGEEESPLGPLVANARAQGYRPHHAAPAPYYGYYYRILTAQGPHPHGGGANSIVNGRMTGGFGLVAFPARYGVSGVMTFIVNQDGIVYQKDLGPNTARPRNAAFQPRPELDDRKNRRLMTPSAILSADCCAFFLRRVAPAEMCEIVSFTVRSFAPGGGLAAMRSGSLSCC